MARTKKTQDPLLTSAPQTASDADGTQRGGTAPATPYLPSDILPDETTKKQLVEYISSELLDVRDGNDRAGLIQRWEKWRRQRRAKPETERRTTPWQNSANIMPPLTAQKVNTIFAKEIAAFAAKKPPVTVEPMNLEDGERAESLEKFFKGLAESRNGLNMAKNMQTIFYNQVSMGVEFVKIPFLIDQWAFKRQGEGGGEQVLYTRHQGPAVQSIRLEDFFTRPYWKDLQRAPWIAVRWRYYKHELQQQAAMGAFDPEALEAIWSVPLTEYDDNQVAALAARGIDPASLGAREENNEYEIYECYVFWDVDGDGIPEDIKLWIEPDTGTLLRSEYNPLSVRDIEPVIYFDDPDSLYGIGVCEMTESLQDEVSTLHNMRLDGTNLSMLKIWLARRGLGLKDEELSPFKMLELDDPAGDVRVLDFPDVAPSCLNGEYVAREYADKVTGASDYMAGFNDKIVGSSATMGGTMFLAQQSNSILNSILQNAELSISNIYQIAFYQCVAHKDKLDLSFLSAEDQANVMEVFSMNVEDIPTKFRFTVKATDISKTNEAQKQNFLAVSQMYSMYGEKMGQVLGIMPQIQQQNPMLYELMLKMYVGSTEFLGKMIEYFDVGNPQDYLPYTDHLKIQLRAFDEVRQQQTTAQKEALKNGTVGGPAAASPGGEVLGGAGAPSGAPSTGLAGTAGPMGVPGGAPQAGVGNGAGAFGGV